MSFRHEVADGLEGSADELCRQWVERLAELIPVEEGRIFPSKELLDHVPLLLRGMAADLREPDARDVRTASAVTEKARELGRLRFNQDASVHQILREFDLLALLLDEHVSTRIATDLASADPRDVGLVSARIHRTIRVLVQAAVDAFSERYTQMIADQWDRLESFSRMASHELRNSVNTLEVATKLLDERTEASDPNRRLVELASRSAERTSNLTRNLETLSRVESAENGPTAQEVDLVAVVRDVFEQLADLADAREVELRCGEGEEMMQVDLHRLEMIVLNLVTNSIKYSDPEKPNRFAAIEILRRSDETQIDFIDNGLGIPVDAQTSVFDRFVRAHESLDAKLDVRGSGLGLSIVKECVDALGATVEFESTPNVGTRFSIVVPNVATEDGSDGDQPPA